jgi:hypothetical protein
MRLIKIKQAIEPRGSRIRISDPIQGTDPGPQTTYKNIYGRTVHTSESAKSLLDALAEKEAAEEAAKRAAVAGKEP